ncbi:MAG: serine/threonine protein kinase [Candidatus Pristimantibacillus sp.]
MNEFGSDGAASMWDNGMIIGGRYRIIGKLGSGGMGEVFAAEDMNLQGKLRAIKVTAATVDHRITGNRAVTEEAGMLIRLNHPNLPLIVDFFTLEQHGIEALVMDFIHGETVGARFVRHGRCLPFMEVLNTALQLCSALNYLHQQNPQIIHRDLKPSNVMVEENGHVRLIDFGIARQYKSNQLQDTIQLGTPGFAAPEQGQLEGQSGPRTDIYGLGALLYYLLSGGRYYAMPQHGDRKTHPMKVLQHDVPSQFITILSIMLQDKQENRYRGMDEVERELYSLIPEGDRYHPNEHLNKITAIGGSTYRQEKHGATISFLSLSPGAGSTFMTITLAKLLGRQGIACTAAEFTSVRPEWQSLLGAPIHSSTIDESNYVSWQSEGVVWHALQQNRTNQVPDEYEKLKLRLHREKNSLTLIDISGEWGGEAAKRWLLQSRYVCVVVDPFPSKWQSERFHYLHKLQRELQAHNGKLIWIANKDCAFGARKEWLSMLPDRPAAIIPQLPYTNWLNMMWKGRWFTDEPALRKPVEQALQPFIELLKRERNTK